MNLHKAKALADGNGSHMVYRESIPWHQRGTQTHFNLREANYDDWQPLPLGTIGIIPEKGAKMGFKLGDWIHSSSGVGPVVKLEDGVPWIPAGGPPGYGFPAYGARPATAKEVAAAKQGRYFTDPDAQSALNQGETPSASISSPDR